MASITTRSGKGSPLTHAEVDANFTNLNTDKAETAAPTFTGQVKVAAGTAAAPGVTVAGDLNTGIYSPGADQVAISTGGTGRLFVDASGRLGIGTSSPGTALDVNGAAKANYTIASGPLAAYASSSGGLYSYFASTAGTINAVTDNSGTAGTLIFATGTERLRITSAGNVGIGTVSPSTALHVVNPTGQALFEGSVQGGITIQKAGTLGINLYSDAAGTLVFYNLNGNTERARIDSSGRLLVGTSTSRDVTIGTSTGWAARNQIASTGIATGIGLSIFSYATYATDTGGGAGVGPDLVFARSNSNAEGAQVAVADGQLLGRINFNGSNGTAFANGAYIAAASDGQTWASGDCPARLVFSTCSDGSASPTERVRITSTGQVRLAGAGITFNGDTATANELDDYEEGTFTPAVTGTTTAGTGTYTVQSGKYIKVGGKVHVAVAMTWTAHTGTGAMWFTGLPFTSASSANGPGVSFGRISNIALTANNLLLGYVASNSSIIPLRQYAVGGSAESTVPIDTAGEVNFSVTYMVV